MKLSRRDLYILAGLGLIVGSFFAAAEAIGGLIALVYFLASTDFSTVDRSISENMANAWNANQISSLVHGVGSFLILFFSGRWMLRGPKMIDRWIDATQVQDGSKAVTNCEPSVGGLSATDENPLP